MSHPSWENQDSVSKFAAREPDRRLLELLDDYPHPATIQVLDLGCAGGRNCELLARRGFDLQALDGSQAMVAHTRDRLSPLLGENEATARVRHGIMDDLGAYDGSRFHLVVALGIYHCATTYAEWRKAISESARVLKPGGRLLVAHFTPQTDLIGNGLTPVAESPHTYDGFPSGRAVLLDQEMLDSEVASFGLEPEVPSQTVRVETAPGRRVTVNALYRKAD